MMSVPDILPLLLCFMKCQNFTVILLKSDIFPPSYLPAHLYQEFRVLDLLGSARE